MRKRADVLTEDECRALLGWHWKPLKQGAHWFLCKYARKRRVHNSVAILMGWAIGLRGARGAGLVDTNAEIAWRLAEGWVVQRGRGQTWLVRGAVRVQVHPDLAGGLELAKPGAPHARSREHGNLSFAPARAREIFAAGLKRGIPRRYVRKKLRVPEH